MTLDIKDLAFKAVIKWGTASRLNQATEELAELIVAINHYRQGRADARKLAEEIADCQLMLEQIQRIAGISKDVMEEVQQARLEKLKRRLDV